MGVKSTKTLSRHLAEEKYIECYLIVAKKLIHTKIRNKFLHLHGTWRDVEDHLRVLLDKYAVTEVTAINVYIEMRWDLRRDKATRAAKHILADLSNEGLEMALEKIHDEVNGGEGFENYLIES